MRLHRLLGKRRLSWIRRCCHWKLRRPEFPCADDRGVGGGTPPLGLVAARHSPQASGEAGVITSPHLGSALGQIQTSRCIIADGSFSSDSAPARGSCPLCPPDHGRKSWSVQARKYLLATIDFIGSNAFAIL